MTITLNRKSVLIAVIGLTLFGAGVCMGRQTAHTSYEQYLMPSPETRLDRAFSAIEMNELRNSLNILEDQVVPAEPGLSNYSLNPKTGKINVLLTVHAKWADHTNLKDLQAALRDQAETSIGLLKLYVRGLQDEDINVTFAKIDTIPSKIVNDFAEYKNGELTIKH